VTAEYAQTEWDRALTYFPALPAEDERAEKS
jgi:hypothetical protein